MRHNQSLIPQSRVGHWQVFVLFATLHYSSKFDIKRTEMKARMRDNLANRNALLHMIGQLHDMNRHLILTGELQAIMGVSKPTAIKRLIALECDGVLGCKKMSYRNNADSFYWFMSDETYSKYKSGMFEADYKFFVTCRQQMAVMKPHNKVMSI